MASEIVPLPERPPVATPEPPVTRPGSRQHVALARVTVDLPAARAQTPVGVGRAALPPRWAVALVALVLVLASVLVGVGRPVGVVLWLLATAGALGVELVRALGRELG